MDAGELIGILAVGFAAGVSSGMLGVGGGIIFVPGLVIFLNESQLHAEATSLLVILPTAIVATIALRRKGIGDAALALRIGTVGAARAAARRSRTWMTPASRSSDPSPTG